MFSQCWRSPHFSQAACVRAALPAILLCLTCSAQAQDVFLPNNTLINYTIPNTVLIVNVGYANQTDLNNQANRTSPTIDLVSGGNVGFLRAYNSSIFNVSGGNIQFLQVRNNTTANVTGGNIGTDLFVLDSSTAFITGGAILEVGALNNSTTNLSGGSIGDDLLASGSSVVNISGGSIGTDLTAFGNSVVNVTGGSIGGGLFAEGNGTLNLFGTGLGDTLVDPLFDNGSESQYALFGTLNDGTNLNGKFAYIENNSNAQVNFFNPTAVPEPGSLALLASVALSSAGYLARRRKAQKANTASK